MDDSDRKPGPDDKPVTEPETSPQQDPGSPGGTGGTGGTSHEQDD